MRLGAALSILLAVTVACTSLAIGGSVGHPALLSDRTTPESGACHVLRSPRTLPAAGALVDSAALAHDLRALSGRHGVEPGYALVSLRYDPDGVNVRREVIEHQLEAPLADSVRDLVFAHRRATEPAGHEWSVRLRLELDGSGAMRVGRALRCDPRPMERLALSNTAENPWSVWRETLPPGQGELTTLWVRVTLDARGTVTDARLDRAYAPRSVEAQLLTFVRSLRWIPATEDGHPVAGETSIALRLPR
jgi:hypothetical protein